MVSSLEVVKELVRYLSGEIDLVSFRDWSVGIRLDQSDDLGQDAKVLLANIEGRYAEFSDHLISEDFLKQRFWALAQGVFVSFPSTAASVSEASSGTSSSSLPLNPPYTSTNPSQSELRDLVLI